MTEIAPIEAEALRACTRPFYDARTLPAEAYHSAEVLDWERRHFFAGSWVCVGRADDLAEPGSQRAVEVGGAGILLIRGGDNELRAFHNTCRHRGHELLPCGASTQRQTVQCPYHRWTYGLDGTFMGGPTMAVQPGFDKSDPDHSLRSARAHEWHGWVFVNATGDAHYFDTYVGNLDDLMAPYESGRMFVGASHSYEIAANWKIIVENYHECYHCTEIHPELCAVSSPTSGEGIEPTGLWVGGTMRLRDGVETMSLDGKSGGVRLRGLNDDSAKDVGYYMLWPNVLISPHPDYVMTHRIEPLAPEPYVRRVPVALSSRVPPTGGFRSFLRLGFLGRHQPAGLERLRIGSQGERGPRLQAGAVLRAGGPGLRVRPHGGARLSGRRSSGARASFL